jgi:hypothetical protein
MKNFELMLGELVVVYLCLLIYLFFVEYLNMPSVARINVHNLEI